MKLCVLVCLSLWLGYSSAHFYGGCPAGWTKFRLSCYRIYGNNANRFTGDRVCRLLSGCAGGTGSLVAINDRAENNFIFNLLTTTSGQNPPPAAWLGGRRLPQNNQWVWDDGTQISPFNAWQNNEIPQGSGRNCMVFDESGTPTWKPVNCVVRNLPYICELPAYVPADNLPAANPPATNPLGSGPGPLRSPVPSYHGGRCSYHHYGKAGDVEQRYTPGRYTPGRYTPGRGRYTPEHFTPGRP